MHQPIAVGIGPNIMGYRNAGSTEEMWFEYGPALLYSSDPGW